MLVFYTTCIDRNTSLLGVQLAPPRRLLVGVVGDLKKKYNKRNEYMRKELKNRYHSFIFTRLLLDRLTTLAYSLGSPRYTATTSDALNTVLFNFKTFSRSAPRIGNSVPTYSYRQV